MLDKHFQDQMRENGFCVVEGALSGEALETIRSALDGAVDHMRRSGEATHDTRLDPNDANIRVHDLPVRDPAFIDLLRVPAAMQAVDAVLGANVLLSNFTANIALPGSAPMALHSDQALVIPEPWNQPWAINIIWCLDDIDADNGATRYLPGSHRYRTFADVPDDAADKLKAFEAPAGSFVAMEGRVWHTSGSNITEDRQRRLIFAYYSMDFIRPQINWALKVSQATKDAMDDDARKLLGLGTSANTRIGGALTRPKPA
jgi:ectoine hydroxylase-related dioxygenase (phytanoyl-CoA dioxygenase family)